VRTVFSQVPGVGRVDSPLGREFDRSAKFADRLLLHAACKFMCLAAVGYVADGNIQGATEIDL
jgi:hypothetical protein